MNTAIACPSCRAAPRDAIDAATHPDPYPYYAALREGPALRHDAALNAWIASRADAVAAVLADPAFAVRPPHEPVPRAIVGTPSGEIFARLVRMNDGDLHRAVRPVLHGALAQVDLAHAGAIAQRIGRARQALDVSDALFAVPVQTVASLLGFADDTLAAVSDAVRNFVACLSPLSSAAELQAANTAATALLDAFATLAAVSAAPPGSVLATVRAHCDDGALPRDVLINLVGLLSQTCDGTAALVGNSLCVLARDTAVAARVQAALQRGGDAPQDAAIIVRALVAETARWDAPVQNTRRFAVADTVVGGVPVARGDAVLLLLAAANRDPARHADAETFDIDRAPRPALGFGHGRHACPGAALAQAVAVGSLLALLQRPGLVDAVRARGWRYRASVNARIPYFL